jgi:hypothetical protein
MKAAATIRQGAVPAEVAPKPQAKADADRAAPAAAVRAFRDGTRLQYAIDWNILRYIDNLAR